MTARNRPALRFVPWRGVGRILLLTVFLAGAPPSGGGEPARGGGGDGRGRPAFQLVREYRGCELAAMSPDGRWLALYCAKHPLWFVTIPLEGGGPVTTSSSWPTGQLRVVELASGTEVRRIPLPDFPNSTHFLPDSRRVITHVLAPEDHAWILLWDTARPKAVVCRRGKDIVGLGGLLPVGPNTVLAGRLTQQHGSLLLKAQLPDCSFSDEVPVDPVTQDSGDFELAISPDNSFVATVFRSQWLLLRDVGTLRLHWRTEAPAGWGIWRPAYTPDGKHVVVVTWTGGGCWEDRATHKVLVYDARDGRLVRRLDVDARFQLAISPDGRWLAAGQKRKKKGVFNTRLVQAVAVVVDFETGGQLATVEHPWVREPHDNPFIGDFGHLAFTPDGKYFLTSTQDTRVWRLVSPAKD